MPRGIRLFEKKRGARRTVSPSAGRLGEAVFYGFFLFLGLIGVAYLWVNVILPEWRANRNVVGSRCRVLDTRVGRQQQLGLWRFRPEIQIDYQVDGKWRDQPTWTYDAAEEYRFDESDAEAILDRFKIGQEYPCWYDPEDPEFVVLERSSWWPWVLLVMAGSFSVFGGVGVVYSFMHARTSAERRLSRMAVRASNQAETKPAHRRKKPARLEYPTVPSVRNIIDSPGTELPYRLPIDTSAGWRLLGTGAAVVLWNGFVAYLIYQVIRSYLLGEPNWLLTAFLLPFVAGGIWLAVAWVRQLLLTAGVGATRIEVENHPFRPGGVYEIHVAQAGRLRMNSLEILLACDERATYHQGTDTRTDAQRVFEQSVYRREDFEIVPRAQFEDRFRLTVPPQAMHSLVTDHNEVAWSLIVRGDVDHWPDYDRRFRVCVYPPE